MNYLDLDGTWQVSRAGEKNFFDARVPGCIHSDLLEAGKIAEIPV